ncbi:hypothetical protein W909_05890 [Dickeya zeae EC1]|nr:hypothetical protein W909_05890 [Dickeya zeae EC1]
MCWLRSLTRITYLSKLIGIRSLAAFLQLELFWVYGSHYRFSHRFACRCLFIESDMAPNILAPAVHQGHG